MKLENLLLIAGVGFIAYWLVKKPIKVIDIDPPMESELPKNEERKTIVLDLNKTRRNEGLMRNEGLFPERMAKDFNISPFKTVSPPRYSIKEFR
jgi:hypothetical protein